jgi:hypothetical protein
VSLRSRVRLALNLLKQIMVCLLLFQTASTAHAQFQPIPIMQYDSFASSIRIPPLAIVAQHLMLADVVMKKQFAEISLIQLLAAYESELLKTRQYDSLTPSQGRELVQWRWETSRMIAYLRSMTKRLIAGAPFGLYVNPAFRVMVIVDGQPVMVTGPRLDKRKQELENSIIEQFCAANDCSWIIFPEANQESAEAEKGKQQVSSKGSWLFQTDSQPRYKIGENIFCVFKGIDNRQLKAEVCEQMLDEIDKLSDALKMHVSNGERINWQLLQESQADLASGNLPVLYDGNRFVKLESSLLAKLFIKDWQRVVRWLEQSVSETETTLVVAKADLLLTDTSTNDKKEGPE